MLLVYVLTVCAFKPPFICPSGSSLEPFRYTSSHRRRLPISYSHGCYKYVRIMYGVHFYFSEQQCCCSAAMSSLELMVGNLVYVGSGWMAYRQIPLSKLQIRQSPLPTPKRQLIPAPYKTKMTRGTRAERLHHLNSKSAILVSPPASD